MRKLMDVAPYLSPTDAWLLDRWWRLSPGEERDMASRLTGMESPRLVASRLSVTYSGYTNRADCSLDEAYQEWARLWRQLPDTWIDPEEFWMSKV